ncbi:YfjI family protein [Roseateles koreensis]|uniref:YfjI family protein n=1 Tax=Roseateles koreensis TaxID=2987526 RepID=A0ABT5KXK1_9BURK|nr:YfjI family protein [Roseateles koreensis]MDC8787115.1 YfjI family protein [Roseateles koreensis]
MKNDLPEILSFEEPSTNEEWLGPPLPLDGASSAPNPFPMDALPRVLCDVGRLISDAIQAPDGIIGGSLIAAASLAVQPFGNVLMPHGSVSPLSLFVISVAESGERKSAVDSIVLRPHRAFEKFLADQQRRETQPQKSAGHAGRGELDKPRDAVFLTGDPTIEGLSKLLGTGLPALGIFSAEGGRFIGGHAMSDDAALRTAAGLNQLWDGEALDRVRAKEGAVKLFGRRVAVHLMIQPRAALTWLANAALQDSGLFARYLTSYPGSTAGTRMYRNINVVQMPEFLAYNDAISSILNTPWPLNEFHELAPRGLVVEGEVLDAWIAMFNDIEHAIGQEFHPIRRFASKAAEQILRVAGCFTLIQDMNASSINLQQLIGAERVVHFYLNEALRLEGSKVHSVATSDAAVLWTWLRDRRVSSISLGELVKAGPAKLRRADGARAAMSVLADHNLVRLMPDGCIWDGVRRKVAWQIRLG